MACEILTMLTRAKNPRSDLRAEILNAVMLPERQHHLRAEPHKRTDVPYGKTNRYKE